MENELKKALDSILDGYDAFYITNKYGDNGTHKNEFELLHNFVKNDELGLTALSWIKHRYDCYYKKDFKDLKDSAFEYIYNMIDRFSEAAQNE